jgi:hypothetical protein
MTGGRIVTPTKPFGRFTALVDRVISVSHEELQRREAEYRKQVDENPKRRGPKRGSKRKAKTSSASPGPADTPLA